MNQEKYYYIKVDEWINGEYKNYGYLERLVISEHYQNKTYYNIETISDKKYAKRYKRKYMQKNL